MMNPDHNFNGMKVLIMGLGINGGGVESALYLSSQGAEISVTDLRDEKTLLPSIKRLENIPVRYVLGRHDMDDFRKADLVIKNPGVRKDSPYLKVAARIETDISLFLSACPARVLAVTGTKGKSSVSSALHYVLDKYRENGFMSGKAWLGGNIAISPLAFLDKLSKEDDVVLELSSWQLGDLRGRDLLKPRTAIITPIMRDHLDTYSGMEAYVNDKRLIYKNQDENDVLISMDDEWGKSFHKESRARPLVCFRGEPEKDKPGGWIGNPDGPAYARLDDEIMEIVPSVLKVPGIHQKQNLLMASLALLDLGLESDFIFDSMGTFPGVPYRLEFFHEHGGIKFYDDTTATIPEAVLAAVGSFDKPVLVAGGTDKDLDFTDLCRAAKMCRAVFLLAGSGTVKLRELLDRDGIKYSGPFENLDLLVLSLKEAVAKGDNVLLSPGCTSFGMFVNEFDRGDKWKEAIRNRFKEII